MSKVKVYSKNGCPQCDMTKNVLSEEGIDHKVIKIDAVDVDGNLTEEAEKARTYLIEELKLTSMPVVVVEGQEPFTGFRPDILLTLK